MKMETSYKSLCQNKNRQNKNLNKSQSKNLYKSPI